MGCFIIQLMHESHIYEISVDVEIYLILYSDYFVNVKVYIVII